MNGALDFLKAIDSLTLKARGRAHALLWYSAQYNQAGLSATEICRLIEQAGHPAQNITRMASTLSSDKKMVARVPGTSAWRIHPHARNHFDQLYNHRLLEKPKPTETDSVLPRALFKGTRGYIEKVVFQINASFDASLYDCCAVMCRRLLETLIIEVYEAEKRSDEIKGPSGHFFMFADLLRILLADKAFNVSRNAQQALNNFKKLGDLSAHNRRYNALVTDITPIKDGIRVASEELLHLAKLI